MSRSSRGRLKKGDGSDGGSFGGDALVWTSFSAHRLRVFAPLREFCLGFAISAIVA